MKIEMRKIHIGASSENHSHMMPVRADTDQDLASTDTSAIFQSPVAYLDSNNRQTSMVFEDYIVLGLAGNYMPSPQIDMKGRLSENALPRD